MTFIRKRDSEENSNDKSAEKKCYKQKEDILKQSIKTVGFEDSTQFFIQSGNILELCVLPMKKVNKIQIMVAWISLSAELSTLFFSIVCTQHFLPLGDVFSNWMREILKRFILRVHSNSLHYVIGQLIPWSHYLELFILTLQNRKALESQNSRGGSQLL